MWNQLLGYVVLSDSFSGIANYSNSKLVAKFCLLFVQRRRFDGESVKLAKLDGFAVKYSGIGQFYICTEAFDAARQRVVGWAIMDIITALVKCTHLPKPLENASVICYVYKLTVGIPILVSSFNKSKQVLNLVPFWKC